MIVKKKPSEVWQIESWQLIISNPPAATDDLPPPDVVVASRSSVDGIIDTGDRFSTRLQLLWTYVSRIGAVAQATAATNSATLVVLMNELKKKAGKKGSSESLATAELRMKLKQGDVDRTESLSVPVYDELTLKALHEHGKFNDAAIAILHETAIQQVVNAFEHLMADLVREHIRSNPTAALKDRTITYQELLEYGSLEEAQRKVTETQVTEFIRNNSTTEQLAYLRKELGIDIKSNFSGVDRFRELVLRRHSIVHAGGVATAEYLRRAREIAGIGALPAEGSPLELNQAYIFSSWDLVYAMGIVTIHLAAQTSARRAGDKDAENDGDNFLNNSALWLLQQGRFACAETVLSYAARLHLARDTCQRMVSINLAQALKWQNRDRECAEELEKHDWTSSSSVFRLAVEVLRDGNSVEKLLKRAAEDGEISAGAMYSWPLFRELRKQSTFRDVMERVFGVSAAEHDEELSVNVLNFDQARTIAKLLSLASGVTGNVDVGGDSTQQVLPPDDKPQEIH